MNEIGPIKPLGRSQSEVTISAIDKKSRMPVIPGGVVHNIAKSVV